MRAGTVYVELNMRKGDKVYSTYRVYGASEDEVNIPLTLP